jgi:hypothetical protein
MDMSPSASGKTGIPRRLRAWCEGATILGQVRIRACLAGQGEQASRSSGEQ